MRRRGIPVFAEADGLVVGGTTGAVATAVAAAQGGARVVLTAPESYLGEDLCGTGQLWQHLDAAARATPVGDALAALGRPLRPMDVKRALDDALIAANVRFLFLATPADLLRDARGRLAGAVLTSKSGAFAVRARQVVDATASACLARAVGLPFTEWPGGTVAFRRVVLGARPADTAGLTETALGSVAGPESERAPTVEAWEYRLDIPMTEWTLARLAEVEQQVRDRLWHTSMTWFADRCAVVPPVQLAAERPAAWQGGPALPPEACATAIAGLHVLGPCAAVDAEAAAQLCLAGPAVATGAALGAAVAAAALAAERAAPRGVRPWRAGRSGTVREGSTSSRMAREAIGTLPTMDESALPVLDTVDVLVVGGGTGGAPAAIAAARAGARTLCVEATHGLGGVGTLGFISTYYHGYREGFTREVTDALAEWHGPGFNRASWNPEHKSEWFRRQLRRAGGALWYGTIASGAVVQARRIVGVVVNTPWGRGIVRAGMTIDATGNSDLPALAGAACREVSEHDLAVQGTGLPPRPFVPTYRNTDYTFVEDSDLVDTTRAFVVGRRKFAAAFDMGQVLDTRERRQIVGDVTVTPLDVYAGKVWRDALCLARSNFDSHGFTVHPIFHVLPPDHSQIDAWLPLRAVLPKGWTGIAVTGLGVSAQRDVMPVLRMQPDIQNQAYGLGLAAAWAAADGHRDFRGVDVRRLQAALFAHHVAIPQTSLVHGTDGFPGLERAAEAAARGALTTHAEIAAAMLRPGRSAPLLVKGVRDPAAPPDVRLRRALLLALMGHDAGADTLLEALASDWDQGWNYTGMGQFGRSLSPLDDAIVALAQLRSAAAVPAVLAKMTRLDATAAFSHFRAVALFAESLGGAALAAGLARLLRLPGVGGHAWTSLAAELADIPASHVDTTTRNRSLRELYLARALFRTGDVDGLGRATLGRYAHDLRGHYAQHAALVLAGR